jgi:hypothetical protein
VQLEEKILISIFYLGREKEEGPVSWLFQRLLKDRYVT